MTLHRASIRSKSDTRRETKAVDENTGVKKQNGRKKGMAWSHPTLELDETKSGDPHHSKHVSVPFSLEANAAL